MPVDSSSIDRIAPTRRPAGAPIGYQRWSDLLFVHWRMPADVVAAVLPRRLTVDTWEGDAWVGLVPFQMSGVRPWWSWAWPWLSSFPETNLRTYVHLRGADPGVWFMSLEAGNPVAVWIARHHWSLNYFWARMKIERCEGAIRYASRRRASKAHVGCEVEAEIDAAETSSAARPAPPGTLEHFLIERYLLYAQAADGRLWSGRVHHVPYPLCSARLVRCEENLRAAAGVSVSKQSPCHVIYSPGVSVEIFGLASTE